MVNSAKDVSTNDEEEGPGNPRQLQVQVTSALQMSQRNITRALETNHLEFRKIRLKCILQILRSSTTSISREWKLFFNTLDKT